MTSPEINDYPERKLVFSVVEGFKNRDLGHVAELLHKAHRRVAHPQSLGQPEQTKEVYLQHTAEIMKLWTDNEAGCARDCYWNPLLNCPHTQSSIPS